MQNKTTLPFLRWAGGKRWLSKKISPIIRKRLHGIYYEPFLGAGAMFFAVSPKRAYLSDLNWDLTNSFQMVSKFPNELISEIRKIPVDKETYYAKRSSCPRAPIKRAVRFIYLNRTCYGGLYRENQKGVFNTPYGGGSRIPAPLWKNNLIKNASILLSKRTIHIKATDFSESIRTAKVGDVVYCDPAYRPVTRRHFDRYGSKVFNWDDQVRLAELSIAAYQRGALVIISNTYCEDVKDLYEDGISILMRRSKTIGNKSNHDDNHKEYLIVLDPAEKIDDWLNLEDTVYSD